MTRRVKDDDKPTGLGVRLKHRLRDHHTSIYAAAIAFFGFVALVPALVAVVSITSLVADADELVGEVESALESAPDETRVFLVEQIRSVTETDDAGVGVAAAVGLVLALWSASKAIANLLTALNRVEDRSESRGFVRFRALAVGLLIGAIVLLAAMVAAMAVIPELIVDWTSNDGLQALIHVGRFLALGILMAVGLSILYRLGPAPDESTTYELVPGGRRPIVSVGAIAATLLFVVLSWGFGVFVRNFGSYNETYGTLAGIIVVLLWLQLSAFAVLIGAEIDSARRHARIEQARLDAGLPATTG